MKMQHERSKPGRLSAVDGRDGDNLRIDQVITRRVDAELRRAHAIFDRFNMDLVTLESSRGDSMDDRELLRALCSFNRTGRLFKRILRHIEQDSQAA